MRNFLQEVKSDQTFVSQPESSKYLIKRFRSTILIHIRFQIKTKFWTYVSDWKLTIMPDIQRQTG